MASVRNQQRSGRGRSGQDRAIKSKLAQAATPDAVANAGAPTADPAPVTKASRNVVKVDLGGSAVKQVKVVDTDLVLVLEDGRTVYVRDGAVQAMIDPEFIVQFSDGGEARGQDLLHRADSAPLGPIEVNTTTNGQPAPVVTDAVVPSMDAAKPAQQTSKWQTYALIGAPLIGGGLAGVLGGKSSTAAATTTQSGGNTQVATKTAMPVIAPVNGTNVVNKASKDTGVTIKGTSEASATVTVLFGGTQKTATADASGNWSVTYATSEVPADAPQVGISATAKTATASASDPATRDVSVDTAGPAAPTFDKVTGDDTISPAEQQAPVTVSGTSEAGATVKLDWAGTTKSVVADGAGVWRAVFNTGEFPTTAGNYTITATATDAAGNPGVAGTRPVVVNPVVDVTGFVAAGKVLTGNGLVVSIYSADGKTLLANNVKVSANGSFSATGLSVGTGEAIIAIVSDANDAADYLDEATGLERSLGTTRLLATGIVTGGAVSLNVNPLTTIAAQQAGLGSDGSGAVTAAKVVVANQQVAQAVGLGAVDVTQVTPVVTNGGAYNSKDGLSQGEKAGALLAALSGLDALNNGSVQQSISDLSTQISGGKLSAQGQTQLLNGAVKAATQGDATLQQVISDVVAQASTAIQFTIGTVAGDNIIAASEVSGLTISGTVAAGATAVAVQFGSRTGSAQISGTTWSYAVTAEDLTALGANGVKVISATATLGDGTTATASRPVGLYTTLPNTPTLDPVAGDGRINAAEAGAGFVLNGNGTAGTTITARWDSATADKTAVVGSNGKWSIAYLPNEVPAAASNAVTVSATDQFGNTSAAVQSSVLYDTTIPAAPTIDPVNGDNKVGLSATTAGVIITGKGERGATVSITWGKYTASSVGVDSATGIWKVTVPPASVPENGVQQLRVTQTDPAGNVSTASSVQVTVAATAPVAPSITSFSTDNYVNATEAGSAVVVRGKAVQGQTVFVRFGDFVAKSGVVGADGNWSALFTPTSTTAGIPTDGNYTVTAYAVDSDLNQSAIYTYGTPVVVDTRISAPTVSQVATDNSVSAAELANGVTISGTADGDVVKVEVALTNGTTTVTVAGRVNGQGGWTANLQPTDVLPDGKAWTAVVTTTDRAGNSAQSALAGRPFEVDTTAPTAPTIAATAGVVTVLAGALTSGVALSGTGEAGARLVIELKQGTTVLFSNADAPITVDGAGNWRYTLPAGEVPTANADYSLSAYQTDPAGNVGTATSVTAQVRTILPPTPTISSISGDNYINAGESTGAITVSGTVAAGWVGKRVSLTGPYGTATATVQDNNTWTADLPARAAGLPGVTAYAVSARLLDGAGNVSAVATKTATVDTTAPTPVITGSITADNVLNIAEKAGGFTVSGTVDSDATAVDASIGGVAGTVRLDAATGTTRAWTATFANLTEATFNANGTADVVLNTRDTAGNTRQVTSTVRTDFVAPATPAVDGGTTLRVGAVALNNGIFLSGTGAAGDTVEIVWKLGATEVLRSTGTITIGANGTWNYTFPGTQVPTSNTYTVEVIEKDAAGNVSPARTLTAVVNTGALGAPTIDAISTDNFVNLAESTATITVTGKAPTGSNGQTVKVSWGSPNGTAGANATTATVSNLAWTVTLPAAAGGLANGTYSVYAQLQDAVGNLSTEVSKSVTVDTQIGVPAITTPITADGVLNITEAANGFSVTGTTDSDVSDLTVTVGGVSQKATLGEITGSSRSWTAQYNSLPNPVAATGPALASGAKTYAVTATAIDRAGNTRVASTTVQGDFVAPVVPTIDADQGFIGKADRDGTIRFTGKAEAGSTVRAVLDGKAADAAVTADAAGNWTASFSGTNKPADPGTANATLVLSATATDRAGNTGGAVTQNVTLDTTIGTPVITGVFDAANARVGYVNNVMRAAGYTIKGTWTPEAGSTLSLTFGGQTFTPVTNADGTWSLAIPAGTTIAASAAQAIRVTATDLAGNTAAAVAVNINVDYSTAQPTVTAVNSTPLSTGGTINWVNLAQSAATTITGTGESGGTVTISALDRNGTSTRLATALPIASNGTWTLTTKALENLADGEYNFGVIVTDPARNQSAISTTTAFTLDRTPPTLPTIDRVAGDDALSVTERGSPVTLTGTAAANSTVKLVWGSYTNDNVTVNAEGKWSVTVRSLDIPGATGGSVPVTVTAIDVAGNTAVATRPVNLDLLSFNPVAGDDVINLAEKGADVPLSGVYSGAPSSFTVRLHKVADGTNTANDVVLTPTLNSATSSWSTTLTNAVLAGLTDGAYTLTATATQGAQTTSSTKTFNVSTVASPPRIDTAAHSNLISEFDQTNGFTVEGTGQPGDTVTVRLIDKATGTPIGTAGTGTADATGKFSVRIPSTGLGVLTSGKAYTLQATAVSIFGNTSLPASKDVTTDFTPPALESFTSTTANGLFASGATVTITATMTQPVKSGGKITVRLNTNAVVELTATADGKTLSGTYTVGKGESTPGTALLKVDSVTAVNLTTALDATPASLAVPSVNLPNTAIRIDGVANNALATVGMQLVAATQTGTAISDATGKVTTATNDGLLRFRLPAMTGAFEAGETIQVVLVGGARDGEVIARYTVPAAALSNGTWDTAANPGLTLSALKALTPGTYVFAVQVRDIAGNLSTIDGNTKTVTVTIDATAPLVDLNGTAAGIDATTITTPGTAAALAAATASVADAVGSEAASATGTANIAAVQVQVAALGSGSLKEVLSVGGATNVRVNGSTATTWNADGSSISSITFALNGVNWRGVYNAASKTFSFTAMSDGTAGASAKPVDAAQAQQLVAALRYTDPNAGSDGLRQFGIRVVDAAGNVSAPANSTVVINTARPAAATTNPVVAIDTNSDGLRDNQLRISFSEAIRVTEATTLANWSGTAIASLGAGAKIVAVNPIVVGDVSYASQFVLVTGTGVFLQSGQTLVLAQGKAIGTGGSTDTAAAPITFTLPRLATAYRGASGDWEGVATEASGAPHSFVNASETTKALATALVGGVNFKASFYLNGLKYAETLAAGSAVYPGVRGAAPKVENWGRQGIKQYAVQFEDAAGVLSPWIDNRTVLYDTELQGIRAMVVTADTGQAGVANAGDQVRIDFREAVRLDAAALPAQFGTGATVTAVAPFNPAEGASGAVAAGQAYATSYTVTLGTGATLAGGQQITFTATDQAGNTGTLGVTTPSDLFARPGTPVIGNVTTDNVIDSAENAAIQNVAIALSGARAGDVVTLYRDGVKIGNSVTLTAAQATANAASVSVAAGAWGADGEHTLTATIQRGAGGSEVSSLARSVYVSAQSAHWSQQYANTIWFDPDTLLAADGATITTWTASVGRTATNGVLTATYSANTTTDGIVSKAAVLSRDATGHVQLLFDGTRMTTGSVARPTLDSGYAIYSLTKQLGRGGSTFITYLNAPTLEVSGSTPAGQGVIFATMGSQYSPFPNLNAATMVAGVNSRNFLYASSSLNLWTLSSQLNNGTTGSNVINNVDRGTTANANLGTAPLGSGNTPIIFGSNSSADSSFNGMMADQIQFGRAITSAFANEVDTYLAVKYQALGAPIAVTASGQTYDLTLFDNPNTPYPILVDDVLQLGETRLGTGNDTVITAGPDYVNAGAGNDVVRTTDLRFRVLDGGVGFDTFALDSKYSNAVSGGLFNLSDYVSNARGIADTVGTADDDARVNANGFHKLQGFEKLDFSLATGSQTVKLSLADIDQLAEKDTSGTYSLYLKLGNGDLLDRSALTGAKVTYGAWSDVDGTVYSQRLTGTVGTDQVALYVRGTQAFGPDFVAQPDSVNRTSTSVSFQFDQGIATAPAATGAGWATTVGSISGAAVSAGGLLTLSGTGLDGTSVLDLTYTGDGLLNASGDAPSWNRIAVGTTGNDTIDFSTKTGAGYALFGLAGNDRITGTANHDLLVGGLGNDTLTGGVGADLFRVVENDTGLDTITDFNLGQGDRIDLRALLSHVSLNPVTGTDGSLSAISNLKLTAYNDSDLVLWADTGGTGNYNPATAPYGLVLQGLNTSGATVGSDATIGGQSLVQLINNQAVLIG